MAEGRVARKLSGSLRRVVHTCDPRFLKLGALGPALIDSVPPGALRADRNRFTPDLRVATTGIDLREDEQLECLRRWAGYQDLFRSLRSDPAINSVHLGRPFLHNGFYPTPDAEIYASFIRDRRPRRIVEVGGGYSTLVARKAIQADALACELTVVDPQPRTQVIDHADRLVCSRIEDLPADQLVGEDMILFVDSSHITRAGGDVPHLFCDVIPALPAGALVHVHDVFLPWDYPDAYRRRLYSEQYVLQALISHAPRYRVVYATHHMTRTQPAAVRETFGDVVGRDPELAGASFWFEVQEPAPERLASA